MARSPLSDFEKRLRKEISLNLKRHTKGITQAELSSMTNIPTSTLSGYFSERSTINAGNVQKIADALKIDKKDIDPRFRDNFHLSDLYEEKEVLPIPQSDIDEINRVSNLIKNRRQLHGLTVNDLANLCDVTVDVIHQWESGSMSVRQIKRNQIIKLSRALRVSPLDFLSADFSQEPPSVKDDTLTVFGKVCAGDGFEAFEDALDKINNPYPGRNSRDLFALKVQGDSMNNVVADGLYAIINKQSVVENGEIAVVLIERQIGMLKRFYKLDDMVVLRPDSTNPQHTPITFVGEEANTIKILGKFIGFVSPELD